MNKYRKETTRQLNGRTWITRWISDYQFSVMCPGSGYDTNTDSFDSTPWPTNAQISEWAGKQVRFLDVGDSPHGLENIYEVKE